MEKTFGNKGLERRADVGQKITIAVISGILTTVFLMSIGVGARAYEKSNYLEVRVSVIEVYIKNQEKINHKLERFLESSDRWAFK